MYWASENVLRVAWTQSWQVAVLAAVVAIVARLACRRRPHLAYLLWMLVIVKALTPPLWSSPTGVFSWATMQTSTPIVAKRLEPAPFPTDVVEPDPLEPPIAVKAQVAKAPPVVAPPEPVELMLRFAEVRLSVWAIGTLGLLVILLARWLKLVRLLRRTAQEIDPALQRQFDALREQLGPRRPVRLVLTSAPLGPAAFGLWRGTVILPLSLARGKTSAELAPILAHELIHLRRFDPLATNVQLIAQVLWWFHPAVWWANRQARIERERACDEEVVAALGCRPADYARLLVEILQWRQLSPGLSWPGMRAWDVTSRRLAYVLDPTHSIRRRTPAWCFLVLLVCLAIALPGARLHLTAAPPEPAPKAPKDVATQAAPAQPKQTALEAANAAIVRLKQLGLVVRQTGYRSWLGQERVFGMQLDVTLPLSFRPGPEPLPLADIPNLRITIGAQSTGGIGGGIGEPSTPGTPPTEKQLREQILAVRQLPKDGQLAVCVDASNAAALDGLEAIPNLQRLGLTAGVPLPEALRFDRLTKLRTLHWNALDDDLHRLAPLKNLAELTVSGRMTDAVLEPLAAVASLKSLTLTYASQSPAALDLTCLEGMSNLEKLTLYTYTLSDEAAERISRHPRIRLVWADFGSMSDAGLRKLAGAKQLETLNLTKARGGQGLTSRGVGALGSLTNLKTLRIDGRPWGDDPPLVVTDQSIAPWQTLENLQWVRIEPCRVTDTGLRAFGRLKSLEKLQLVGQLDCTDQGLVSLSGLNRLQTLVLPKSTINGSGLVALAGLERLERLSLKDTPIDDAGLEHITKFKALRELDLAGSAVTDRGLQLLRDKLPALERLNVARTQTSDQGFEALLEKKKLRDLDASGTKLTAALLARMLQDNHDLKVWVTESGDPQSAGSHWSGPFQPIEVEN